mmetsp:Transcript_28207/g.81592  ORF Transcript_28207/g.81592 Transcript_28207/m.81592 type:complete len:221 (-) Transcript_28207:211-873(-)
MLQAGELLRDDIFPLPFDSVELSVRCLKFTKGILAGRNEHKRQGIIGIIKRRRSTIADIAGCAVLGPALVLLGVLQSAQYVAQTFNLHPPLGRIGDSTEQEGNIEPRYGPGRVAIKVSGAPNDRIDILRDGVALDGVQQFHLHNPAILQIVRFHVGRVLEGGHAILGAPRRADAPDTVLGSNLVGQSTVATGRRTVLAHNVDCRHHFGSRIGAQQMLDNH